MASNLESSIHRGSDLLFDFYCFTCQENERNTEAEFYCEECSKFYCSKCVEYHTYLFKKHATLDKKNISQWPNTNVGQLDQCQEHKKEKLTGFCEDHSQLICHACHVHNHQKCSQVVLIADKVKYLHKKGDFKQLSSTVDTQHQQLIHMKDDFEENMKSLQKSYTNILEEINALRKAINVSLDLLEKNTKNELDTFLATMRTSIQTDIENCTKSITNITCLKKDWLTRKDKTETLHFIKYRKCLDQSLKIASVFQEMTTNYGRTLTFNPDTSIKQTLSTLSGLGQILSTVKELQPAKGTTKNRNRTRKNKPKSSSQSDPGNQKTQGIKAKKSYTESSSSRQQSPGNQTSDVTKSGQVSDPVSSSSPLLVQGYQPGAVSKPDPIIKVKSSKKYSVKIERDLSECCISGICETATGELLITDHVNSRVKLLDQTYKVVAHCDLPGDPRSMCSIDSSQVAVALYNEVHFIRVTNGQLVKDRMLKLKHICWGIAHHQGNLYITNGIALYHYTVDGRLVSKTYDDTSPDWTVTTCAVSPDGERIYVTNQTREQLVTLSRDGTVISTFTDPAVSWSLDDIPGLSGHHVTDSGQVLVCGGYSHTILQVDRDGRQKLAEVVTKKDGITIPTSVYYSKHTRSLIVGMTGNNNIMVFKVQ